MEHHVGQRQRVLELVPAGMSREHAELMIKVDEPNGAGNGKQVCIQQG